MQVCILDLEDSIFIDKKIFKKSFSRIKKKCQSDDIKYLAMW